jgi:two-component system, sensor histidine kinase and response regulator
MDKAHNLKVLIVDDNSCIHEDYRKILKGNSTDDDLAEMEAALFGETMDLDQSGPFELESAYQGDEAIELVSQAQAEGSPFAVAFVDMRMPPGKDGLETIEELWKIDPDLLVVICSAYSDYSWNDLLNRLKPGDRLLILKKPFDPAEVLQLAYALTTKWNMGRKLNDYVVELQRRSDELQRANIVKSQFFANMSHELRTPLNAIIGMSETLQQRLFGDLTPKQERYVGHVITSGHHLLDIVNDILDLAKIEAAQMHLDVSLFEPGVVMRHVVSGLMPMMDEKNMSETVVEAGQVGMVIADEAKFRQILYNLLGNAIKFTPDGGRIALRGWVVDDILYVSVEDSGIGIALEDQERIFARFEQVDSSASRAQQGTGLGLTLTKRLVELHGGKIWVESLGKGLGSTFIFMIPTARTVDTCGTVSEAKAA